MIYFKVCGINFFVSVGFVGILCLVLYIDKVGLLLPTTIATVLHEIGHIAALILLKAKPQRIELRVGALGISGNFLLSRKSEVIMLMAGSGMNFLCFGFIYSFYCVFKIEFFLNLSLVMLVVGVFNLLPIIGLDGGDILNILLNIFLKGKSARCVLVVVSMTIIILIFLLGLYVLADTKSNISLILFGLYLFLGILLSKKQKNDCKILKNRVK